MSGRLADPGPHLERPDARRRYNRALFDLIAPRYDEFTRWFSFGMDARWKRMLAAEVVRRVPRGAVVLDLACGTGDLLAATGGAGAPAVGRRIGLDLSAAMLREARRRFTVRSPAGPPVSLIRGDLTALPLPDASADAVTIGYGLRSAPDLESALHEVARVLRPGGVCATLDFFVPGNRAWRAVFLWYLRWAGCAVGRWWHGDPHAYGYIEASLRGWLTAGAIAGRLEAHGLRVEADLRFLGGGIAVHVVRR